MKKKENSSSNENTCVSTEPFTVRSHLICPYVPTAVMY